MDSVVVAVRRTVICVCGTCRTSEREELCRTGDRWQSHCLRLVHLFPLDCLICCSVTGSENNHLYVYYKGLADPLMSYDFTPSSNASNFLDPSPGRSTINSESANDFVSAVCWKKVRPPFLRAVPPLRTIASLTGHVSLSGVEQRSARTLWSDILEQSILTLPCSNSGRVCGSSRSNICGFQNTNVVVAANSQGTTHILELI
jgi:hypothetical protein